MCSDALFSELERELRARFDVTDAVSYTHLRAHET